MLTDTFMQRICVLFHTMKRSVQYFEIYVRRGISSIKTDIENISIMYVKKSIMNWCKKIALLVKIELSFPSI